MRVKVADIARLMKCGEDNLRRFSLPTENGYELSGWMCTANNFYKGSLIIDSIREPGGKVRELMQYVQGMPKLRFITERYRFLRGKLSRRNVYLTEKLDGTNIVFYPIFIEGEVIDVCMKTRGLPLISSKSIRRNGMGERWYDLVMEAGIYDDVVELVYRQPYSYSFELYGRKNLIGVRYDFPIRMTLICVMKWSWIMDYPSISRFGLDYVKPLFEFRDDYAVEFREGGEIYFKSFMELAQKISQFLDAVNEAYRMRTGSIKYEGVVWNVTLDDRNHLYKNKSYIVMPLYSDLRKSDVRRVIWEGIHIYGMKSDYDELLDFVVKSFESEYGGAFVERWMSKIREVVSEEVSGMYGGMADFLEEAYRKVYRELNGKVDDLTLVMRTFAQLYPDRKSLSRMFYRYVIDRGYVKPPD